MSDELPEITRRIYNDPQNSALLVNRAMHLSKLGFADIAAGDAYKAIQLLDASLRRLFGSSRSNYDDLSGIPSAIEAVSAEAVIQHKTSYIWFVSILVDTGDKTTAQKMIQKARARYPSDPELETMEKSLAIALEEQEKARQLTMATIDPKYFRSDPKFGSVRHLAYPFIPKAFLSRSEQLIRTISREIEAEARAVFSGCSLRSSPVQDPTVSTSSGAPTALGVFATCDIAKGFPFLIDTTVLAATDTYGRSRNATEICDNCYGTIPMNSQQKRSATCCAVVYCSQNCRDLAWKNYHQVLCKQEFNWVWDDSRTGYSEYDLDGPMWLRILAVCVQSRTHPLEHSLFARLTPLYDEHLNRRWSLSNNIVMPIKILQQLGIDIYTDSRYDTWILQTLWARILTNVQIEVSVSGV